MGKSESVDKLLTKARKASQAEDWITAHAAFASVLKRFPKNPRAREGLQKLAPKALPALLKQAQQQQAKGDWVNAEETLQAAWGLSPSVVEVGLALAACRLKIGSAPAALEPLDSILRDHPDHVGALNQKGRALREMGLSADAKACFERALALGTMETTTLNNLGILAQALGEKDTACAHFNHALELEPDNIEVHFNRTLSKTFTPDDPDLNRMLDIAGASPQPPSAKLHFALFKALDDAGRTEEAFAHLETANKIARAQQGFDFKSEAVPYALSKALLSKPVHLSDTKPLPFRPIFITGLPRSGTTLVERILARADGVQVCGELTVAQLAVNATLKSILQRQANVIALSNLENLRAQIVEGLSAYSDGSPILVDKMPLNFRWIGFIAAAIPEAQFIHVNRNPMAVAWSLYRMSFSGAGHGFMNSFEDIASYLILHRDWMTHWRATYPDHIHDLSYDAMVTTPEPHTRALAKAIGLDWTDNWLTPEKATSQVLTASSNQVRKPMYQGSNNDWMRYENALGPLRAALQTAGFDT